MKKNFPHDGSLRAEDQLLLCLSQQYPLAKNASTITELLNKDIDWTYLTWRAYRNRIAPLIYWRIKQDFTESVPGIVINNLRDIYRGIYAHNAIEASGLLKVLKVLAEAGISAVPYRGSILAMTIYNDLALRQNNHSVPGILVCKEDLQVIKTTLMANDYNIDQFKEDLYIKTSQGKLVKVKWSLASVGYPQSLDAHGLWERLNRIQLLPGRESVTLCAEDMLIMLCLQGTKRGWRSLNLIADVVNLINNTKAMDWELILQLARTLSCQRMLFTSLILAKDLFSIDLPVMISKLAYSDPMAAELAQQAAQEVFNPVQKGPDRSLAFQLRLIESLEGKISLALEKTRDTLNANRRKFRSIFLLQRTPQVSFEPTGAEVVDSMLALAEVRSQDLVYDLGCGDGRIVVGAASRYGARAVGFDVDPQRIAESRARASAAGVEHLVSFIEKDAAAVDLSPATVVTLYMGSSWSEMIRPRLQQQLAPGARIVSHQADFPAWPPSRMRFVTDGQGKMRTLFLWQIE